jgi:hypothetical protein
MAKPATTHVIEIESGIGEPAFIPLTLGQELQPISVGKKGMWRVEGAKVLDVHAFVYFDGTSLFLQSADEQNAALVDGYRVGKAWTELHAPCRIEVGAVRLRFRSLVEGQAHAPPPPPAGNQGPTVALSRPPVQPPPAGLRETQQSAQPPRPAAGEPPMTFPKPARPFAPGALAHPADEDESTRIAPLEATGGRPVPGMSGAINAMPAPRPAAGRPVDEDLSTRPEAARTAKPPTGQIPSVQVQGTGGYQAMGMPPGQPMPPGMVQGVMPLASMPPGMQPGAMQSGGYPAQPGYPPPGYPPPHASGAYGAMPSGAMPPMGPAGPSMAPGGYGSTTQGGQQPATGGQGFSDLMKDPAQRKKLMALGVILLGGAYVLLMDDDPPAQQAKKPVLHDGGADAAMVATGGTGTVPPITTTAPTPASPCPPGFQPYGAVQPGQPITCVPNPAGDATAAVANAPRDAGAPAATDSGTKVTTTSGQKTLERQAIDYVATGEYGKAIGIYEKLSQQFPDNKVYSEALRILRMKLDAGVQ